MKITIPKDVDIIHKRVKNDRCSVPLLIIKSKDTSIKRPVVFWIHGGGFLLGMKEMVYMSRAIDLVERFKATVVSPGYTLSFRRPYPQALIDCYCSLLYIKENIDELNGRSDQIFIGGESAGGNLAIATSLLARDQKSVNIAYQMPLYPMIDYRHTRSSVDNRCKVWNSKRNEHAWKRYLKGVEEVTYLTSPSLATSFKGLPPCYTFICTGDPFFDETLDYVKRLKEEGIEAKCDIYDYDMHAFDMIKTRLDISIEAKKRFLDEFQYACDNYFIEQ